ncbi:MAG: hypothetical protein HY360_05815 [Verrucomicrobia bacterium]|nr:hypothetical protein [Verrucomicrobiota bacterium]
MSGHRLYEDPSLPEIEPEILFEEMGYADAYDLVFDNDGNRRRVASLEWRGRGVPTAFPHQVERMRALAELIREKAGKEDPAKRFSFEAVTELQRRLLQHPKREGVTGKPGS